MRLTARALVLVRRYVAAPIAEYGLRLCFAFGNRHMQPGDRERIESARRLRKTGSPEL